MPNTRQLDLVPNRRIPCSADRTVTAHGCFEVMSPLSDTETFTQHTHLLINDSLLVLTQIHPGCLGDF